MSERDSYAAGVPCWVEVLQDDPRAAAGFYGSLFGWRLVGSADDLSGYLVARLRGRDVAGIATRPSGGAFPPAWLTHVRVASVELAARRATAAGGTLVDGPIDAAPAGRLAVLDDPTGARFAVWEAETREGAAVVNEPGAWAMSALQTADPVRAAAFYRAVFGWQTEPSGPIELLRLPGYVGGTPEQPVPRDLVAVMAPLGDAGGASRWAVDFWVTDAEATARLAVELGGGVLVATHDRPPFRSAVLADPEGAAFSVSQLVVGPRAT